MLIAGGCVNDPPSIIGTFSFHMNSKPSEINWPDGSACIFSHFNCILYG